jgi:hypothetical protein
MALHHQVALSRLRMMAELTPQEMGRYLAGLRRQVRKQCIVCGRTFTGVAQRKYCSHACTQRAYYRRKKGQQPDSN